VVVTAQPCKISCCDCAAPKSVVKQLDETFIDGFDVLIVSLKDKCTLQWTEFLEDTKTFNAFISRKATISKHAPDF
jgi:hypothetical protein